MRLRGGHSRDNHRAKQTIADAQVLVEYIIQAATPFQYRTSMNHCKHCRVSLWACEILEVAPASL